jgi:hypothetical protein
MKPSRIFRLSRIPSTFHFVELAQLVIPTTSPPGGDRHLSFQHQWQSSTEKFCFFNGLK